MTRSVGSGIVGSAAASNDRFKNASGSVAAWKPPYPGDLSRVDSRPPSTSGFELRFPVVVREMLGFVLW